jgi:hypothetical protein
MLKNKIVFLFKGIFIQTLKVHMEDFLNLIEEAQQIELELNHAKLTLDIIKIHKIKNYQFPNLLDKNNRHTLLLQDKQ